MQIALYPYTTTPGKEKHYYTTDVIDFTSDSSCLFAQQCKNQSKKKKMCFLNVLD